MNDELIHRAADLLRASKRPCVLTGAGVSKESGIPTFRDALDGLWAQYDPRQLATMAAFQRNPKLVWDFYEMRRERMRPAQPNPGHHALAALEAFHAGLPIITQNIDDLHERAGSRNVIHLHGLIARNKCVSACKGEPTLIDITTLTWDSEREPPRCPHCAALVRPDVVWFGEMLPSDKLAAAQAAIASADLMLVIGTSGVVSPAAEMPYIAKRRGAVIIEINPFESEITPLADVWLQAPSGEALPRTLERMGEKQ
ncbi:MAG: NAD-dependent deacylase [Chloroflexota bacterium]|nr:NAD-dependent deacylase [Chloroflexota bacterium]